jgi:hypothetical protein
MHYNFKTFRVRPYNHLAWDSRAMVGHLGAQHRNKQRVDWKPLLFSFMPVVMLDIDSSSQSRELVSFVSPWLHVCLIIISYSLRMTED